MAKRIALLIGNKTFVDKEQFPDLRAPANDVNDFADLLLTYGNFEILGKFIDEDDRIIKGAIEDLYNQAERGDLVLLYYSGHGYRDKMRRLFLVAQNTRVDRPLSTGVLESFIRDAMSSSRSRHRVIILDCCFSGAFINGQKGGSEALLLDKMKGEASVILASSSRIQVSYEENRRNSLFTHHMLEGIRTGLADQDKDGWISIDELFDYIDPRVRGERPEQTPMIETITRDSKIFLSRNPGVLIPQNLNQDIEGSDWIYAYNFGVPLKPLLIRLPAGRGVSFKQDVDGLLEELRLAFSAAFSSNEYYDHKRSIEKELKEERKQAFEKIQGQAQAYGLDLMRTSEGYIIVPGRNGEIVSPDKLQELSSREKESVENHVGELQPVLERWLDDAQQWEHNKSSRIKELDQEIAVFVTGLLLDELREKYSETPVVSEFLDGLQRDILKNIDIFRLDEPLPREIAHHFEVYLKDDYEYARMWAMTERLKGNYEKARELFARVVQINPQDIEAWKLWEAMEQETRNKELSEMIRSQIASLLSKS